MPAPMPPIGPTGPTGLTYAVVYYLLGGASWVKVAEGWDVDVATLVYQAPQYVFVWWWTGTDWTSEVVYGEGHTAG